MRTLHDYVEPWGVREWEEALVDESLLNVSVTTEINREDLIPMPGTLVWSRGGVSTWAVRDAFKHYQTAIDFLNELDICYQEFEKYPSPFPPPPTD
ncbi:MAG: hypothetical protein L6277_08955 [Desulfobacterales bacterium]|nr:hypothetical protein [Pseudomonadota bacterium]MBU4355682.1 hypothetical protein [Pseudomonadota bacterium]MCG2772202.1 hypothetical protein [Desulfobacterales bacterium]